MSNWKTVKLGELLEQQKKSKIKAGEGSAQGKFKFFTSSSVQNKFYDISEYEDGIVFGTGGKASVHYCNEKFATSTDCIVFYAKENADIEYVNLILRSNIQLLENGFKGAGLKHISKDYILNIDIPYPNVDARKKILFEINTINNLIEKRKQQLEKLDLLVKAKFIEMFGDPVENPMGWEEKLLEELFTITSSKRILKKDLVTEGVRFFKIADLLNYMASHRANTQYYIDTKIYDELKKTNNVPKEGDILITSRGTLGKCYVIKKNDRFYFQDGMISWLIRKEANVVNTYVSEIFKTYYIKSQIKEISKGATVDYLSISKLKKLKVILPPYHRQREFAEYVDLIQRVKNNIEKLQLKLETLYKSKMQEYFG